MAFQLVGERAGWNLLPIVGVLPQVRILGRGTDRGLQSCVTSSLGHHLLGSWCVFHSHTGGI
jgi:hypothetical protein